MHKSVNSLQTTYQWISLATLDATIKRGIIYHCFRRLAEGKKIDILWAVTCRPFYFTEDYNDNICTYEKPEPHPSLVSRF